MAANNAEPYLKYAIFCRGTEETPDQELTLKEIIDLVELPSPEEGSTPHEPVLAELDLHLAFCIAGGYPRPTPLAGGDQGAGNPLGTATTPTHRMGRRDFVPNAGSKCFGFRCRRRASTAPPSCWTACRWARPASWSGSSPMAPPRRRIKPYSPPPFPAPTARGCPSGINALSLVWPSRS